MKTEDVIKGEAQYILQTYGRPEFVLERGNGVYLFDMDGKTATSICQRLGGQRLGLTATTECSRPLRPKPPS